MADTRPNILWICTDQQRYDTINALGYTHVRTPHVDGLVETGTAFLNAYAQSPICTPSRASFLTGCYPSTIHVNRNGNEYFPCGDKLITSMLAKTGYDCGLAGKLHIAGAQGRMEPRCDDGYRVFRWSHHHNPEEFWPNGGNAYQQWLVEQGVDWDEVYRKRVKESRKPGEPYMVGIDAQYHQTTWCANEAIAFMAEERGGPWLMSVNPFDPHPPFDPPPEYMDRMDVDAMPMPLFAEHEMESQLAFSGIDHQTRTPRSPHSYDAKRMVAAYCAQIELIDDQVGRMLRTLEETGQRDNTIIVFTSDHGDMVGDHGLLQKGCRFYEGQAHVPLIISWPKGFAQNLRSHALVELADLVPTQLEALGMAVPDYVEGKSLMPILAQGADPATHRDFVRCEYHDALPMDDASHANMIFDGRHKLMVYHGHDAGELYDRQEDPSEFHNLWDDPASQAIKLDLMKRIFDATMLSTDPGQPRAGRF